MKPGGFSYAAGFIIASAVAWAYGFRFLNLWQCFAAGAMGGVAAIIGIRQDRSLGESILVSALIGIFVVNSPNPVWLSALVKPFFTGIAVGELWIGFRKWRFLKNGVRS